MITMSQPHTVAGAHAGAGGRSCEAAREAEAFDWAHVMAGWIQLLCIPERFDLEMQHLQRI